MSLTFRVQAFRANAMLWEGKNADAVELWRKIPGEKQRSLFFILQTYYATALINLDRFDEAASLIDEGLKTDPKDTGGSRVFERRGRFGHFHHAQYNVAAALAVLNRPAEAMKHLREAAADGFPCYPLFVSDRNLDNLSNDPNFAAFLAEQKKFYDEIRARYGL